MLSGIAKISLLSADSISIAGADRLVSLMGSNVWAAGSAVIADAAPTVLMQHSTVSHTHADFADAITNVRPQVRNAVVRFARNTCHIVSVAVIFPIRKTRSGQFES